MQDIYSTALSQNLLLMHLWVVLLLTCCYPYLTVQRQTTIRSCSENSRLHCKGSCFPRTRSNSLHLLSFHQPRQIFWAMWKFHQGFEEPVYFSDEREGSNGRETSRSREATCYHQVRWQYHVQSTPLNTASSQSKDGWGRACMWQVANRKRANNCLPDVV